MIDLDTEKLAKDIKITVNLRKIKQFRLRLWIAEKLLRLALVLSWVDYDINETHPLEADIIDLGNQGLVVSIAYGPMRGKGNQWSIDMLNDETRESFNRPYQANSFDHCIKIAYLEAAKRGWLK